jgi:hypothetical protein
LVRNGKASGVRQQATLASGSHPKLRRTQFGWLKGSIAITERDPHSAVVEADDV